MFCYCMDIEDKKPLRWLDIVLILCARAPLLNFWAPWCLLFRTHTEFLILQNLDFANLSAIFWSLFFQFPSVNLFKIWQHGKTRFQLHDERFKFTNQKLQYFSIMETAYFNITGKLVRSPPLFSLLKKLWLSNLPVQKILKHFTEEIWRKS